MDENDVIHEVDRLADQIESDLELAAHALGLTPNEMIDRIANELKDRFE